MLILAVEFYHDRILYSVYVSKSLRCASTMSCPYTHLFGVHVANSLRHPPNQNKCHEFKLYGVHETNYLR